MGIVIRSLGCPTSPYNQINHYATEEERELICRDEDAIMKMFDKSDDHDIDPCSFIEKRYSHILLRSPIYKDENVEFEPFTEAENIYMASPEHKMSPEEYWKKVRGNKDD